MSTAVMVGREAATRGVEALSFHSIPCAFSAKLAQDNKVLIEDRQGQDQNFAMQVGHRYEDFNVSDSALYHDTLGWWLLSVFGEPTVTSPEAGVYSHVFKFVDAPESLSLRWQQPRRVTQAYQALYGVVDQFDLKFAADGDLTYALSGVAMGETEHADISHSFAEVVPFPAWAGTVLLGGGAYANLLSGSVSIKRNRKPFFTIENSQDPHTMSTGSRTVEFDLVCDFETKDEYDIFKDGDLSSIQITWVSPDVTIGLVSTPTFAIKLGKIAAESGEIDDGNDYPSVKLSGKALYNASDASLAVATLISTTDYMQDGS